MAFLYSKWLALPISTRHDLAHAFGIPKTGPTHVDTNRVVSDGYSIESVEAGITPDNLRAFLKTKESDDDKLFAMLLEVPEPEVETVEVPVEAVSPAKEEEKAEKVEKITVPAKKTTK